MSSTIVNIFKHIEELENDPGNKDPLFPPTQPPSVVSSLDVEPVKKVHIQVSTDKTYYNIDINRFTLYKDMILDQKDNEFTFTLDEFVNEFELLITDKDLYQNFIQDPEHWYQVLTYFNVPRSEMVSFYKSLFDDILEQERLKIQKFFEDNYNQISDYQALSANPNFKDDFFERHPEAITWGDSTYCCFEEHYNGIESNPSLSEQFFIKYCRNMSKLRTLFNFMNTSLSSFEGIYYKRDISLDLYRSVLGDHINSTSEGYSEINNDDKKDNKLINKYIGMSFKQWSKFIDKYLHLLDFDTFFDIVKCNDIRENVIELLLEKVKINRIIHKDNRYNQFISRHFSLEFILNHFNDSMGMYINNIYGMYKDTKYKAFYFNLQSTYTEDISFVKNCHTLYVDDLDDYNESCWVKHACVSLEDSGDDYMDSPQVTVEILTDEVNKKKGYERENLLNELLDNHFLFTPGATFHFFFHTKSRREKFTFDKDFQRIIKEEKWCETR